MNPEKRKKASKEQQSFLINYLEGDLRLARNQFSAVDGRENNIKKWQKLANTLNALGGSDKTGQLWKKYWEDLRLRIKEKYMKIKRFQNTTGDNGDGPPNLTDLERNVISIISYDAVEGDDETEELCDETVVMRPKPEPTDHSETQQEQPNVKHTEKPKTTRRSVGECTSDECEFFETTIKLKKRKIEILEQIAALKKHKLSLYEKYTTEKLQLDKEELEVRKRELVLKEKESIALHGDYLIGD